MAFEFIDQAVLTLQGSVSQPLLGFTESFTDFSAAPAVGLADFTESVDTTLQGALSDGDFALLMDDAGEGTAVPQTTVFTLDVTFDDGFGLLDNVDGGGGGDGGEIIVTGRRYIPDVIVPDGGSGGGFTGSGGGGGGSPPTPNDRPHVMLETTMFHTPAEEQAMLNEATKLATKIAELDPKIDALADDARVVLKDGSVISGAALKAWWAGLDFTVTDRSFGPGRTGAYENGMATINYESVKGWSQSDPQGLSTLILHELIHHSPNGQALNGRLANEYYNNNKTYTGFDKSIQFDSIEEFSNWGAREIGRALGLPDMKALPTHGYNDGI